MSSVRVLHVDDEPDIREVVEISLGLEPDFETRGCASGHEALAVADEWLPRIILLDVMMPGMDGPTTLARLRENARTAKIPVVFMTARVQNRELERLRAMGAAGVIPKPFDPTTLADAVRPHVPPADGQLGPQLQSTFLRRLNSDAEMLANQWSLLKGQPESPAALAQVRRIAHGLVGAGGIFGFPDVSDAASELEEALMSESDGLASPEGVERAVRRLLDCIELKGGRQKEP